MSYDPWTVYMLSKIFSRSPWGVAGGNVWSSEDIVDGVRGEMALVGVVGCLSVLW